jgi:hypothetical protein
LLRRSQHPNEESMSDFGKPPPDFGLLRAVEIFVAIAEKQRASAQALPPATGVPIVLFNEHVMFVIGKTRRADVIAELGPGYAFPATGWESYAMHEGGTRCLLSARYHDEVLAGVEYYVATNRVPELRARNFGAFRLVPGQITIGSDMLRLDERFVAAAHGPDSRTYSHSFYVAFPGGVAYAQGTGGHVQRLVLYATQE